jgi:hypothetical protein
VFEAQVWKAFIDEELKVSDLEAVDQATVHSVNAVRELGQQDMTEEEFASLAIVEVLFNFSLIPTFINLCLICIVFTCVQQKFTTKSADGREVALKPNGEHIDVTLASLNEWCDLVLQTRLNECMSPVLAMKEGLAQIIPLSMFKLLTWQEMEQFVCGRPCISVDGIKSITTMSGVPTDLEGMYWEALNSMTTRELQLVLKFICGRGTLPLFPTNNDHMKVQIAEGTSGVSADDYFPHAQTCYRTLNLRRYSSMEILRKKLLYAAVHCRAIDLDFTAAVAEGQEDDEENFSIDLFD